MILSEKILFLFNKFFISFVKDIKDTDDDFKVSIKKNYKVIDKSSDEHLNEFWGTFKDYIPSFSDFTNTCADLIVLKDIKVSDIITKLGDDVEVFWNYIYILSTFSYLFNQEDQSEELFNKVVDVLGLIQKGTYKDNLVDDVDDILDDDIKTLLLKITPRMSKSDTSETSSTTTSDASDKKAEGFDFGSIFGESAKNSKIANLAKEISEEIDVSSIKIEKPEDIMKMMDFSSSNNVMGDIIKKVSSKITDKIQNGDLNQQDLLSEAMGMMSMMGGKGGGAFGGLGDMLNNPMVAEFMKSMKKGKPMNTRTDLVNLSSTRDRLRRKLDEKNKNN